MKILKGTAVRIKGKLYPEGSSIPKANEEEFRQFLVDKNDSTDSKNSDSTDPKTSKPSKQ